MRVRVQRAEVVRAARRRGRLNRELRKVQEALVNIQQIVETTRAALELTEPWWRRLRRRRG